MDPKLIDLVAQLSGQADRMQWAAVVIIVCLAILTWYLRSRIDGYAKKLGEIEAETAKLPDIAAKLAVTTEVTESIRSEFSQKEWRTRERTTLLRTKLEAAVESAYQVCELLELMHLTYVNAQMEGYDTAPLNKMNMLTKLYFPNLFVVACAITSLTHEARGYLLQLHYSFLASTASSESTSGQTPSLPDSGASYGEAKPKIEAMWLGAYSQLRDALSEFEKRAMEQMKELVPAQ